VISTATNTVSETVSVGSAPYGVAVTPDSSRVYVANFGAGSVSVISTATNTVSATATVGSSPYGVAVSPDSSRVYATNAGAGTVSVIDAGPAVTAPSAPISLNATAGVSSALIAFTAGADGGSAITKYQYKVGSGAWVDAVSTASPITVTGLTNYQTTRIQLRAVNAVGSSPASVAVSARPRLAGPSVTGATPSGSNGVVVTFSLNPLPGTTVAYQSVVAYARGTNTVRGSCRTYARRTTCFIAGLTRATEYDLRVTAHLPVPGKAWHHTSFEGSILEVRTGN
jgi:YVTN family beta-propeller protein